LPRRFAFRRNRSETGHGAFAKAHEEGGKVFAKPVKEGTDLQKRTQKLKVGKISDVAGTVNKVADNMSRQAATSWDNLEQVFEERVARSLQSLEYRHRKISKR
jgi:poly(hydroxyalkanoate) granule-associated protein